MTKVKLLSTVAAALLVAGVASAQELKKNESPAPAPAAQQNAPAEKIAPNMHAGDRKLPETTGQAPKAAEPDKAQALDKGDKSAEPHAAVKDTTGAGEKAQLQTNDKSTAAPAAKTDNSAAAKSSATTGQGAAGAARLSTEQRTKITTIIRQQKVEPAHLNVSVSVGTRVPPSVHLYPVPVEVINIYPDWRGFDYILVGDEIVIIDPATHEIVAIVEA